MPHLVTKDFKKVFQAFLEGKEAVGGKVSMGGGSGHRCRTDGNNLYSYNLLIAKRMTGYISPEIIVVLSEEYAPSRTTKRHIRAVMILCNRAQIVRKESILTWDFKFNSSY